MEFDPNDPSTWDERSKDNYDEEGNLKEVLMLSPTSYPKKRFTKEGDVYYYTRINEEGVVEPITGGNPFKNFKFPNLLSIGTLKTEEEPSTDWSLKDLAYPLNVPFGGKRQGNLGDWTFTTWLLNQAPGQISAVGKAGQALKGKYFYKSPVKQPINVTPKDSTQTNIKDTPNKGIIPKYSSGAVVLTKDGPLYRPTERLASIFQMDADASLLKDASRIPRPDLSKPFRTEPHTATLSESEYTQAWFNYPDHSKEGWNKFQEEQGVFITDTKERFKLKPKGRDFGPNLDESADKPLHGRTMRREKAT